MMADQIVLTVLSDHPHSGDALRPILDEFERNRPVQVVVKTIPLKSGYKEIHNIALNGQGADVSEVNSTWINGLAAMETLRPYQPEEIEAMGGEQSFVEQLWKSGFLPGDSRVWAIPWTAFSSLLYYRKVWLEKVGIDDPDEAMDKFTSFENTLERLKLAGALYPWVPTILRTSRVLHEIAPWIWGAGGEIINSRARIAAFTQAEAINGLRAYFSLHRFVPSSLPLRADGDEMFLKGETPLVISGPWLALNHLQNDPKLRGRAGICKPPGSPYLGGTSLVIWKNGRQTEAALDLVRFLAGLQAKIPVSPHASLLPARRDSLARYDKDDDLNRRLLRSLAEGRGFEPMPQWGLIEDGLTGAFAKIWAALLDNPALEVDSALHQHLDGLAAQINLTLGG